MTCKQFRANMLENRKHLLSFTMRCKYSNLLSNRPAVQNRILKVSNFNCVTDLVFRCLDCNEPVCRVSFTTSSFFFCENTFGGKENRNLDYWRK